MGKINTSVCWLAHLYNDNSGFTELLLIHGIILDQLRMYIYASNSNTNWNPTKSAEFR